MKEGFCVRLLDFVDFVGTAKDHSRLRPWIMRARTERRNSNYYFKVIDTLPSGRNFRYHRVNSLAIIQF